MNSNSYTISNNEEDDIKEVVRLARIWGYGNLIDRIKVAWALKLLIVGCL